MTSLDSFKCRKKLTVGGKTYYYFSFKAAEKHGLPDVSELPFSMKILLENLLRFEDSRSVTRQDIEGIAAWLSNKGKTEREIAFRPARVLMQDFTGVPAVVDLAAMRDAMTELGGDPQKINPLVPVDLVIDHSVIVDAFASSKAFKTNVELEYGRNGERYRFLKWGQDSFDNFRVVPPGTGICHQVNLEYLARTVWTAKEKYAAPRGKPSNVEVAYPDTLVGTDSHTTMVNGLSVLGWGVGGIEAEACMLGQPLSMLLPEVIGFRLTGALATGVTATDLVLTVTQMLRRKGVVGKFVEFYGTGLSHLSLADRATIANMAPECGATCNFFPIDSETLAYLATSGRAPSRVALVEAYAKAQGLFRTKATSDPVFTDTLELDLGSVVPSMAGPKRPEGRVALGSVGSSFKAALETEYRKVGEAGQRYPVEGKNFDLGHGDVVIAAITSCTNTSNPNVLIGAGLLARNAVAKGIGVKPWVKTSLAPGSQVVAEYLSASGLQKSLDKLGFNLVGFGCTTCIGNSGPLAPEISKTINDNGIIAAAVLSGNRNFEGRISPDVQANYLASPPLVVAHALAGTVTGDLETEPLGHDKKGHPVFLKDIWPSQDEIAGIIDEFVTRKVFKARYADVFNGDTHWRKVKAPAGETYKWDFGSTYVRNPPYFDALKMQPEPVRDIENARILAIFGDKITTDHISPAGAIKEASPAGQYLVERRVSRADFNQYGTRRGNHEIMMRGTFANIRIKNFILQQDNGAVPEGGLTKHWPDGEEMPIFDAAMKYQAEGVPLVVFAGAEYGNGSSRDWAAKGTKLLGVRAVIAESFERIHRSNLVGMGVLPLTFEPGTSWKTLGLTGDEEVTIHGLGGTLKPRQTMEAGIKYSDGRVEMVPLLCRIATLDELEYFNNGGILPFVLRQLAAAQVFQPPLRAAGALGALLPPSAVQGQSNMARYNLFVLPGDGIGPEVMAEAEKIAAWLTREGIIHFEIEKGLVGGAAYDAHGAAISDADMARADAADAVLLAAVGGPKWDGVPYEVRPEAGLLRLRKDMSLFANLRPAICYPALADASSLKRELVDGLDLMIVRELTGGVYFGEPKQIIDLGNGQKRGIDTQVYDTYEIERIGRIAFELARKRRNKVTSADKRNVMKSGVLWNEVITSLHAREYPGVELEHQLADALGMQLVRRPKQFDVIVTDNLFGDMLSDVAAMLTGSLGMLPSASLGEKNVKGETRKALYEPVHGAAPDIAGKGIANPIAMIGSFGMALRYSFNLGELADRLEKAISDVLEKGLRTADIAGGAAKILSTSQMGDAILAELQATV